VRVVSLLVADGRVDINSRNVDFSSPLHSAVYWGEVAVVRVLLDNPRVNVNSVNYLGQTPLHLAQQKGVLAVLLTDKRVDVNRAELHGHTPLHIAAGEGRARVVESLLGREDINLDMEDGGGGSVRTLSQAGAYSPEIAHAISRKLSDL
jgi:ankyrin repeat protein